jgi:iron complex transport system substrate-binding protein
MAEGPRRAWLLALVVGVGAIGCAPPAPTPSDGGAAGVEIRDDQGSLLRLTAPARRIVSLAPAHTEILYAIGAGDHLLAADTYSTHPPEAREKATLNCWPKPPVEALTALRPEVILVFAEEGAALKPLREAGLPVCKLFPRTLEDALACVRTVGRIAGRETAAERLAGEMSRRFDAVRTRVRGAEPRSFAYELDALDPGRPFVAGGAGLYSEVMSAAGGRNVFADLKLPAAQVSAEQVVARRPDVLFLGDTESPMQPQTPELVRRRPGWGAVPAVRAGRVYPLPSDLVTRPGPRLPEGMERVARLLHPERFP